MLLLHLSRGAMVEPLDDPGCVVVSDESPKIFCACFSRESCEICEHRLMPFYCLTHAQ